MNLLLPLKGYVGDKGKFLEKEDSVWEVILPDPSRS